MIFTQKKSEISFTRPISLVWVPYTFFDCFQRYFWLGQDRIKTSIYNLLKVWKATKPRRPWCLLASGEPSKAGKSCHVQKGGVLLFGNQVSKSNIATLQDKYKSFIEFLVWFLAMSDEKTKKTRGQKDELAYMSNAQWYHRPRNTIRWSSRALW